MSIGKTPFEVVYGRQPPSILRFLTNETKVAAVAMELSERDEALNQLKLHLSRAQDQMASYVNKKRRLLVSAMMLTATKISELPKFIYSLLFK